MKLTEPSTFGDIRHKPKTNALPLRQDSDRRFDEKLWIDKIYIVHCIVSKRRVVDGGTHNSVECFRECIPRTS